MSNVVGTLVIEMAANVAKLTNDMAAVKGTVGNAMTSVEGAIGRASKALGMLGIGVSIAGFGTMVKGALDSAAAFHDLSMSTGASVSSLAGFEKIGRQTNTTGDDIAKMMGKLAKGMAVTTEETKGVNAALAAIGINVEDFRKLKPDQQMLAVAKAMEQYADGSGKAAVAQVLFGRAGAESIPFLKDLANATEINSTLTAEGAAAADEFSDRVADLSGAIKDFLRTAIIDLLPILTRIVDGLGMAAKVALAYWTAMVAVPAIVTAAGVAMKTYAAQLAAAQVAAEMGIVANVAYSNSFKAIIAQVGLLKAAMGVLFAAFAGWQIGTYLRENFLAAQLAGIAFVEGTLVGWERIKYGAKVAWAAIQAAAATAIETLVVQFANMIEAVGRGLKALGANDFGQRLIDYANSARKGADSSGVFAAELVRLKKEMDSNIAGVRAITGDMAEYAIESFGAKTATAGVTKELNYSADAAADAAKNIEAAAKKYGDLMSMLGKTATEAKAAAAASDDLTDAQKLEIDVLAKLTDGTVKLTAAQTAEVKKALEAAKAALTARDAYKAQREAKIGATTAMEASSDALQKEIQKQRDANAAYGKTAQELERLEIARLEDAAAIYRQQAALLATIPGLEQEAKWYAAQAEGLKELVRLKNEGIHVKAATEAAEAWQKTTESIFDGLTDALFRAFESGKGFAQAFKDTLANAFKTLILQPTIKAIMGPIAGAMGGMMGGTGTATAGTVGGGGSGMLGSIGNIASGIGAMGGMLGAGVGYGLGWLGGSATLAGTLSGAGAMVSGGLAGGMAGMGSVMAGLGAVMGALAPIAAVVAVLANNIGRHPKRTRDTGVEGQVVGGEVNVQMYRRWQQSGGWFHDRREGTSYSNAPDEVSSAINDATKAIFDQMTAYTDVLGLPAAQLAEVRHTLKYSIGKTDEETAKNAEAALAAYTNALAGRFAKVLTPFQRAGEQLADTLSRLATIQSVSVALNEFGGVFSRIARLSVDAREELIAMAGGIEALMQKSQAFVGSYYSESEQLGINAKALVQALSAAGINAGSLTSKAEYRALVESRDVTTTTGREQFNLLLSLAPAFAQLADALAGRSLGQVASTGPTSGALADLFSQAQIDSLSVQQTAVATTSLTTINTEGFNALQRIIAAAAARAEAAAAEAAAIQVSVAASSAITARLLQRWDADGQLSTTTALP